MLKYIAVSLLFIPAVWASPDPCLDAARKGEKLSDECRADLRRLNQVVKDSGVRGGGLSSFGGIMGGLGLVPPKKTILSLEGMSAYEGNPTVIEQGKASLVSPMWIRDNHSLTASLSAGTVKFNEAVKGPRGINIRELHRVEVGGQYTKTLEEHRLWGLRGALGSAGDKPFQTGKEYTFSLNGFFAKPGNEDSYWVYSFFLSNNSPILNYIPIPGITYFFRKENFTGMLGLPLMSLQWTPVKNWAFSVSYFITNFRSVISYSVTDRQQALFGFSVNQQTFLREGRKENTDRLFVNDKRLYAGWKSVFTENFFAEFQMGQSFDRVVLEGKRFNDANWKEKLGRSWFLSSALTMTF